MELNVSVPRTSHGLTIEGITCQTVMRMSCRVCMHSTCKLSVPSRCESGVAIDLNAQRLDLCARLAESQPATPKFVTIY